MLRELQSTMSVRDMRNERVAGEAPNQGCAVALANLINGRIDRLEMCWPIWLIIGQLSLAFFFEVYSIFITGYIAPSIVQSGVLTTTTVGLFGFTGIASFVAAFFAGSLIGTLSAGFFADRLGRRWVFLGALLWFAITSAIMAVQHDALSLNIYRFFAGIGIGIELVTIATYISELVPKEVRGRAFAFNQTIGYTAVPVVAFFAWVLARQVWLGLEGWRWVVLIGSAGAVASFFMCLSLPESPRWLAAHGRTAEADKLTSDLELRVQKATGRPLTKPVEVLAQSVIGGRFVDIWRPPFRRRAIMLIIFNIFQTVGFYGFVNWAPTLLVARGVTIINSLMYVSVMALAAPVGPLLGLLFADRLERKHVIMLSAAGIAIFGLVFGNADATALIIAAGIFMTLCQNIMSFSFHAYQSELFATSIRAKAVGFVYAWSRLSGMFSAFVIAFVLRLSGPEGVFAMIAAAMLVVVCVVGLFGPHTRRRSVESIALSDTEKGT